MNRREWLTYLAKLAGKLWAETRGVRRPKARALALIDAYKAARAAAGCRLCQAGSHDSYSAGIARTVQGRFGLVRGVAALIWSCLIMSAGPRDQYGWRRGGV
jgi:hypothetical protein